MKFSELKEGSVVYHACIRNSELESGEIKAKQVSHVHECSTIGNVEIYFSDNTMIIPGKEEESTIRGINSLSNLLEPFNFSIYSTSYNLCLDTLSKIISTKLSQINNDYNKLNTQMARMCLMSSVVRNIEKKEESVVLEPVYAD